VLSYLREYPGQTALVCLNFKGRQAAIDLADAGAGRWELALSTHSRPPREVTGELELGPDEGVVLLRA